LCQDMGPERSGILSSSKHEQAIMLTQTTPKSIQRHRSPRWHEQPHKMLRDPYKIPSWQGQWKNNKTERYLSWEGVAKCRHEREPLSSRERCFLRAIRSASKPSHIRCIDSLFLWIQCKLVCNFPEKNWPVQHCESRRKTRSPLQAHTLY